MTATDDAERIAELVQDNTRLRRLLDQRDAPGELRHRLRGTLALLRTIIRRTANTGRGSADYVAHLEDRLDAIARAQAAADQHGEVDLRAMLADELLRYGASEGERLLLRGPEIRLQPRAGQLLALAAHELAVNAVEHGVLGNGHGEVEVCWEVAGAGPDAVLVLAWVEAGVTPILAPPRHGFGTEVLTRMLAYEFNATTGIEFAPSGLRCTIRMALTAKVGRVAGG